MAVRSLLLSVSVVLLLAVSGCTSMRSDRAMQNQGVMAGGVMPPVGTSVGAAFGMDNGKMMDGNDATVSALAKNGVKVIQAGDTTTLYIPSDLVFAVNSSRIKYDSYPVLGEAAKLVEQSHNANIEVHAFTDNVNSNKYNKKLSQQQAGSVAFYLWALGIKENRITNVEGYGATDPLASNTTEPGRESNRRVEVIIKKHSVA